MECLHQHIAGTLKNARNRDVFISLYIFKDEKFEYVTHQPIKRDVVSTKSISINEEKYSEYECVKCTKSDKSTTVKIDCADYHRSSSNRHKNIKHYVGMKLWQNDELVGFLNIEIYKIKHFEEEEEAFEYIEQELVPFKYLLEYQFAKLRFFQILDENYLVERA